MKDFILTIGVILLAFSFAMADELVPATSDDLSNFDEQVKNSTHIEASPKDSTKVDGKSSSHRKDDKDKDNFGKIVSSEAKKLKDSDSDSKKGMGTWVSDQRRQDDKKHPDVDSHAGAHGSDNDDAHSAAPNGHSAGSGSPNSNGHGNSDGGHGH